MVRDSAVGGGRVASCSGGRVRGGCVWVRRRGPVVPLRGGPGDPWIESRRELRSGGSHAWARTRAPGECEPGACEQDGGVIARACRLGRDERRDGGRGGERSGASVVPAKRERRSIFRAWRGSCAPQDLACTSTPCPHGVCRRLPISARESTGARHSNRVHRTGARRRGTRCQVSLEPIA